MMNNHYALTRRALVATGVAIGLGLSQGALAERAGDDLEITAGLSTALTVECTTALSFGIIQLSDLNRTSETTITVASGLDTAASIAGDFEGVSVSGHSRGLCAMSGSADSNSALSVEIDDESVEGFTPTSTASVSLTGNATAMDGLGAPTAVLSGLTVDTFTVGGDSNSDANGAADVFFGAKLTIPAVTITAENLGGYSNTIAVTIDDGFGN